MRRLLVFLTLALVAFPLFAVDREDCATTQALASLYQIRAMMLRPYTSSYDVERWIDGRLEDLREPLGNGGYRWVKWVRPASDAPTEKKGHLAVAVKGEGDADRFEASSDHVWAVRIEVPEKRSLFNHNNAVFVGTVEIQYDVEGRPHTRREAINQWMNPDTRRTVDLGVIADHVTAALDAATNRNDVRESLVEIHFVHAVPQDDPENPAYPSVRVLDDLRHDVTPRHVDDEIARLEERLYPNGASIPLLGILADLRRADDMIHSKKTEEQEKGDKLLKETLRRLH